MQTGEVSFAYIGITNTVKLIPAATLHQMSAPHLISANFGYSPFRWNPLGEDNRLPIPRSLLESYNAFFVAATMWEGHHSWNNSSDGLELSKSIAFATSSRCYISTENRRLATSMAVTTRAIPTSTLTVGTSYYEVEVLQLHTVDG